MNTEIYKNLLSDPDLLKDEQVSELKDIIVDYPYFQSARALYLKGLKNQDSFKYNNELKITAAFSSDRSVLFDFITSILFKKNSNIHKQISKKIAQQDVFDHLEISSNIEQELSIGKPIHFSKNETHSFQEWLKISTKTPIKRKESITNTEDVDKEFLINRFIDNNPKISSVKMDEKTIISVPDNKTNNFLMTETLAKVYLEQKKFSSAIKAYDILSLKYPEKSGFFADQIKKNQNFTKYKIMSYNLFLAVILLVAVILILIVMVQNPKGGGLSSSFGGGGAQSLGGVQNTNNFLDRTTWTLAIAMFALILLSNFSIERNGSSDIKLDNALEDIRTTPKTNDSSLPTSNDSL